MLNEILYILGGKCLNDYYKESKKLLNYIVFKTEYW